MELSAQEYDIPYCQLLSRLILHSKIVYRSFQMVHCDGLVDLKSK